MIKVKNRNIGLLFVFSIMYIVLSCSTSFATGPQDGYMPIWYQNTQTGIDLDVDRWFSNSWYVAGSTTPWCTHFTHCRASNQYDHFHFGVGYPFTDTARGNEVTAQKAFWSDEDYYPGWSCSVMPTCQYNCHNYAMNGDSDACIESSANGSDLWLTDSGYSAISEPVDDCIGHTTWHSWVINYAFSCEPENLIEMVSEKDSGQGIWHFMWSTPGAAENAGWDHNNLYGK